MRRVLRSGLFAAAMMIGLAQVAACSPKTVLEQQDRMASAEAAKPRQEPQSDAQTKDAAAFAGDWAYRADCDRGHYVTLSLSVDASGLNGAWSDGTQLGGLQGSLKGSVQDGKLVADWCSDDTQAGSDPICPAYAKSEDYFILRGQSLHWYRKYGAKFSEYVIMKKGADGQRVDTACA